MGELDGSTRQRAGVAEPPTQMGCTVLNFVSIPLGNGQVCACTRCATDGATQATCEEIGATIAQLTTARFAAKVAEETGGGLAAAALDGAILTGAEPFAHPDLVDTIARLRATGIPRIAVQTSATALAAPANAAGSIGAGVRVFEVVLLGGEARHDVLTGEPGSYAAALAGIAQVREAARASGTRVFISALIRLCAHSRGELIPAVVGAVGAGVRAVRIEASAGAEPSSDEVRAAHEVATTAGIALFGDGAEHILGGASLYTVGLLSEGEVRHG